MRLTALFLLLSLSAGAQNASPNLESFELPTLPECWQTIDADADGFDWTSWFEVSVDGGEVLEGNTGEGMMISQSFDNAALVLNPDNYLILPQLNIQEGEHLTYAVAGLDPDFSAERYSVVLSTTGSAEADFTEILYTDTLSAATFMQDTVLLSAYVGQQVYIAFRHHNVSDQFVLRIDDVQYPTTVNECAILVSVDELEELELSVYPNPVNDLLTIKTRPNSEITLTDYTGKTVYTGITELQSEELDLSQVENGIYILTVRNKSGLKTERIVVQH